jgi:hypothetical protein
MRTLDLCDATVTSDLDLFYLLLTDTDASTATSTGILKGLNREFPPDGRGP